MSKYDGYSQGSIAGFNLWLPEHRAARWVNPWWEAARLRAMHHYMLQEPGITIEVGAEEGDFAALFALWGQKVVLVEPNPKAWPWIRRTFEANGLDEMAILKWVGFCESHERRLPEGDPLEHQRIATGQFWPGCSFGETIPEHGFHNVWEHPTVTPGIELDLLPSWTDATGKIAHISIDVEGAELIVLRGARSVLEFNRPRVFVSVHKAFARQFYGQEENEIHLFMDEYDYKGVFLASDHEDHWMFIPKEKM